MSFSRGGVPPQTVQNRSFLYRGREWQLNYRQCSEIAVPKLNRSGNSVKQESFGERERRVFPDHPPAKLAAASFHKRQKKRGLAGAQAALDTRAQRRREKRVLQSFSRTPRS